MSSSDRPTEDPPGASRRPLGHAPTRHIALGVGLVCLLAGLCEVATHYRPSTFINRDGRFYTNTMATLTDSLSLEQPYARSWYSGTLGWNRNLDAGWSNIALGRNGEHYPKHPLLLPILASPFFYAFDLGGALLFNVLMFLIIGAAGFAFARRYTSAHAAAIATTLLVSATAVRLYAYDFHVDVLLLALFLSGIAALHAGRGVLAGVLVALAVTLKPTTLMWGPTLVLFAFSPAARIGLSDARGGAKRVVLRACAGGAAVLVVYALVNTALFGRPWWAGYNRILVVVNGEPQIADVAGAFEFPLRDGLVRIFDGRYGLRHRFLVFAVALPGLVLMARRAPRYVVGAALGVVLALLVFAKYNWEGDRFLWPAIALLLPALGHSFAALHRGLVWCKERVLAARRIPAPPAGRSTAPGAGRSPRAPLTRERREAAMVVVAVVACVLAVNAFTGPPPERRLPPTAHDAAAVRLRTHGDLSADALYPTRARGEQSWVSQHRSGRLVVRTSPAAALLGAPIATSSPEARVLMHGLWACMLAALLILGAKRTPPSMIAAAALVFALPFTASQLLRGGPGLYTAVFALTCLWAARAGRPVVFSVCLGACLLVSESIGLGLGLTLALVCCAFADARRVGAALQGPMRRMLLPAVAAWLFVGAFTLVWWGRPFTGAQDFVRVAGEEAPFRIAVDLAVERLPALFSFDLLQGAQPSPLRAVVPLLLLAAPGVIVMAIGARANAAAWLAVFVGAWCLPAEPTPVPTLAVVLLVLPLGRGLAVMGAALDGLLHRVPETRGRVFVLGALVALLFAWGGGRRAWAAPDDSSLSAAVTEWQRVRHAQVELGGPRGPIPCDFFAWEHQNWECATFDRGLQTLTGLRTSGPVRIEGEPAHGLYLPTGRMRQPRTIRFPDFPLTDQLRFDVHLAGPAGVQLEVLLDDTVAATWTAGESPSRLRVDTAARRGEHATLGFRVTTTRAVSAVLIRGGAVR